MTSRLDELARELATINLQIRRDMERAEAKVAKTAAVIQALGSTGLLAHQVFLGSSMERPYDAEFERSDSGQVIQAALLVPDGFGVCLWDMERFVELRALPDGLEQEARITFQPFDDCSPAEKKFLLPFIEEALEDLTDVALVAAAKLENKNPIPFREYFSTGE